MAKEISRTFDVDHGRIFVVIEDAFGKQSPHTIYAAGVTDINTTIAALLARSDEEATVIRERMQAAGWSGSPA